MNEIKIDNKTYWKIVDLALCNVTEIHNGVVQINKETGEIIGCSLTSNEKDNEKKYIELFRLEASFDPEEEAGCFFCSMENECHREDVAQCSASVLYDRIQELHKDKIDYIIKRIKYPNRINKEQLIKEYESIDPIPDEKLFR